MMWSIIKMFGPQHCDLPTMIWNVDLMLRVLLLNIDSRNKKPNSWISYLMSIVLASCFVYVYVVSMAWFVFVWCRKNKDLLDAVLVFSLGVASEIGNVKLIFMFLYIHKVRKIVSELLAYNASIVAESRFAKNLLITLRKVKKRAITYFLVILYNGFMYCLKPFLFPGRHLIEDGFIFYGLEPMLETPNYEIAYLVNTAAAAITCYITASITAFLIIIVGYIEAQMLALGEELQHIWDEGKNHFYTINPNSNSDESYQATKNKIINQYVATHLKDIIKTQIQNISVSQQIEYVFSGAIALKFLLLIISLIAKLLGSLENTFMTLPFAMMQVGIDCFIGQRLMEASIKFETAVYDCKWENFNKSNMKTVQIMLLNSQKTMKLSACSGIIILGFPCLMQVNRSVYSAYTTLRTVMH